MDKGGHESCFHRHSGMSSKIESQERGMYSPDLYLY